MKTILLPGLVAVALACAAPDLRAQFDVTIDPSSPVYARALDAAMPEFEAHKLDLGKYRVEVVHMQDGIVVFFSDPNFDRPPGWRGSSPNMLEFTVELGKDKDDSLYVIRANFVR